MSGASLAEWDLRWRAHLETVAKPLPPEHALTRAVPNAAEVSRRRRLGELLLGREHFAAAAAELKQGHALMPREASVRCLHGDALRGLGEEVPAGALFADPKDIFGPTARWWSLHAAYELTHALPDANLHALGHNPMDPRVACQERPWGELPSDPLQRAICEMAWQTPAWRNLP